MSRRNYDLKHDIELLTLNHSTWIHSVYLNAGGGSPYDDSWIAPIFATHSTWISSLGAYISAVDTVAATKQDSFDLASKADSSWVASLGVWVNSTRVPAGGDPGQALTKVSSADNDVAWSTISGGGAGASDGLYWALVAGDYP